MKKTMLNAGCNISDKWTEFIYHIDIDVDIFSDILTKNSSQYL